jgi:hypothetical protein
MTNQEIEQNADQTAEWEDGSLYCECGQEITTESFDAHNHLKVGYFSGTCDCGVDWEIVLSVKNDFCDLETLIKLWYDGSDIFPNVNKNLYLSK